MRVSHSRFIKMIGIDIERIADGHTGYRDSAIGITPSSEAASLRIQEILFTMGYRWYHRDTKVQENLRSLYVRPLPTDLAAATVSTAEELQARSTSIQYIISPITDVTLTMRLSNFEDEKES